MYDHLTGIAQFTFSLLFVLLSVGHGHGSRIRTCDFLSSDRESTGEGEENHKKSSKKKKKRRRMGSPLNQQDSSGLYQDVQDIKDMLRTLCHKVDKNDLALREIQTTR